MLQAIAKARQAPQQGEVPVGALIVDPAGTILAAEHNQPITLSDPSAHAEIMAMRSAGAVLGNYRLEGCILVVTLEPCLMCTGAIVHARRCRLWSCGQQSRSCGIVLQRAGSAFPQPSCMAYGRYRRTGMCILTAKFFSKKQITPFLYSH